MELANAASSRRGRWRLLGPQSAITASPRVRFSRASSLKVVLVDDLHEQLHACHVTPLDLLQRLSDSKEFIKEVDTSLVSCALVSYRQEPHVCKKHGVCCANVSSAQQASDERFDGLTMDGDALLGVIEAARRLDVKGVWCDKWCYRAEGAYDHRAFTDTLHDVMAGIVAVIWLPRSKASSSGEYQYRLWTTFEASCVEVRGLPVVVAGIGMSAFQQRVRMLGSFTPALIADGTIDSLCRLNVFFYLSMLVMLFVALGETVTLEGEETEAAIVNWVFLGFLPIVWIAWRGTIGQQLRLAGNARRVLCTMSDAPKALDDAKAAKLAKPTTMLHAPARLFKAMQRPSLRIMQDLPWLPAHDRRDVLIVQKILRELLRGKDDIGLEGETVRALAFSAYTAARLLPSDGDRSASDHTLSEWLDEVDISLEAVGGALSSKAPRATSLGSAMWLHAFPSSSTTQSECLPLSALRSFGWVIAPGASCALISPLGALHVDAPVDGRWSVSSGAGFPPAVERPKLDLAGTVWLAFVTILRPWPMVALLVEGQGSASAPVTAWMHTVIIWMIMFPLCNTFYGYVEMRSDMRSCGKRFFPLPALVFSRPCANCALATWMAIDTFIGAYLSFQRIEAAQEADTMALQIHRIAAAVCNIQMQLIFFRQAVLLCVFTVSAHCVRGHEAFAGSLG